ncbi:BRCA1-associated RING domain protein 1-like [Saccoglossus kowalevskii]|uniref:BRCA1-associated RING domain protein 1-like n=1 Tax=Saccoglossus kowalevskii TaxID=10224 RepID=A0ABM0MY33_SACKO|nr:PREDICTED: BRCA1-associated RING domain protein 1-like [Saccoglossus kowalevskii]
MEDETNRWEQTKKALGVLESTLECPLCHSILKDPSTLGNCDHSFCRSCVGSHLGNSCPVCSAPAWVKDLQTNRQLTNVVHLCMKLQKIVKGNYIKKKEERSDEDHVSVETCDDADLNEHIENENTSDKTVRNTSNNDLKDNTESDSDVHDDSCHSDDTEDELEEEYSPDNDDKDDEDFEPASNRRRKRNVAKKLDIKEKNSLVLSQKSKTMIETKFSSKHSIMRYTVNLRARESKVPEVQNVKNNLPRKKVVDANNSDVFDFIASPTKPKPLVGRIARAVKKQTIESYNKQWSLRNRNCTRRTADKDGDAGENEKRVSFREVDESVSRQQDDKYDGSLQVEKENTENKEELGASDQSVRRNVSGENINKQHILRKRLSEENADDITAEKLLKPGVEITGHSKRPQRKGRRSHENTPATGTRKSVSPKSSLSSPVGRDINTPVRRTRRSTSPGSSLSSPPGICSKSPGNKIKRNAKGETALHIASIKGDAKTVKELLESGFEPNLKDNAGWTPLHEACNHGYIEIVTSLLDHGAFINTPGYENDSPLHDALYNRQLDIVKLLVQRGASLDVRNIHGLTPWDVAKNDDLRKALNTVPVSITPQMSSPKFETMCRSKMVDIVIVGTGLKREQKAKLDHCAKLLKGKVLDEFDDSVSHVVTSCNEDGQCPRTMKYLQAILHGKWIVSFDWVTTCLKKQQLVEEQYFEVTGTVTHPFSLGPRKARLNHEQQYPGLFNGCHFYFHGKFNSPTPVKEDLNQLVKSGDGKILLREPKMDDCNSSQEVPYHATPNSDLSECTHYIIHDHDVQKPPSKIRSKKLRSASVKWLMDSISQFTLLDITD